MEKQIQDMGNVVNDLKNSMDALVSALTELTTRISDVEESQKGSKPILQSMAEQIGELSKKVDGLENEQKGKIVSGDPVKVKKETKKGASFIDYNSLARTSNKAMDVVKLIETEESKEDIKAAVSGLVEYNKKDGDVYRGKFLDFMQTLGLRAALKDVSVVLHDPETGEEEQTFNQKKIDALLQHEESKKRWRIKGITTVEVYYQGRELQNTLHQRIARRNWRNGHLLHIVGESL